MTYHSGHSGKGCYGYKSYKSHSGYNKYGYDCDGYDKGGYDCDGCDDDGCCPQLASQRCLALLPCLQSTLLPDQDWCCRRTHCSERLLPSDP